MLENHTPRCFYTGNTARHVILLKKSKTKRFWGHGNNIHKQMGQIALRNDIDEIFFLKSLQEFFSSFTIVNIAMGEYHTSILARKNRENRNRLFAMGKNMYKQCSDDNIDSNVFKEVKLFKKVVNIWCGRDCSFYLSANGKLFASGYGGDGELGVNSFQKKIKGRRVRLEKSSFVIQDISAEYKFTIFLRKDGIVFYAGRFSSQMQSCVPIKLIQPEEKIIKISCGLKHFLALTESGFVYGMGTSNDFYQLCNTKSFQVVIDTDDVFKMGKLHELQDHVIFDIKCGYHTSLVLSKKGVLIGFGCDMYGQLGETNKKKELFFQKNIVGIESGLITTYMFDRNGNIKTCGYNVDGECGNVASTSYQRDIKIHPIKWTELMKKEVAFKNIFKQVPLKLWNVIILCQKG